MADKIKKFFQKKKADARFKMAGPGHKLSESSTSTAKPNSEKTVAKRVETSEASKVAAQAALARLSQRRENPEFNTSIAAIKAKVKRELEQEKSLPGGSATRLDKQSAQSLGSSDITKMATTGVYFRCPMISNKILTRDEWKREIRTFLYEQLEAERGLTACLIIFSCNKIRENVRACAETLCRYLENIISNPEEEKYHKIRVSNRIFRDKVEPMEGAIDLLWAAGFRRRRLPGPDGEEEDFFVFDRANIESIDTLVGLVEALRGCEGVPLELDRSVQVLLPSQAAARSDLPQAFYTISPEELKREQMLRMEAAQKSQMLRTKAMRDKEEMREMRKYKFALIRVRFPDGILLQGTFSVYERFMEIHEFVRENLEHELPFVLSTPTGSKLSLEEDGTKSLIDLRLVPATVLIFAWHPSVVDEINNSPNKDVFLKPEVMMLVQNV